MASGERLELTCLSFWYTARAACWGLWEHARVSCLLSSASGRALLKYYVCAVHAHTDERRAHRTGHSHLPHAQSPHTLSDSVVSEDRFSSSSRESVSSQHTVHRGVSLSWCLERARDSLCCAKNVAVAMCVCDSEMCRGGQGGVLWGCRPRGAAARGSSDLSGRFSCTCA